MNNKFSRIICGFLSVVMCICSTVHMTNISAEDEAPVPVVADAITATASSVTLKRDGNFITIDDTTEVRDGDELSLNFAWETIEDDKNIPPVTFSFDLSSQLKNISLDEKTITTNDATYRIVGQMLYIDIAKGKSGRSGTCNLTGNIDLTDADVNDEGRTEVTFLNKTFWPKAPGLVSGLYVNKSAGTFEKVGDAYYQNFKVEVYNGSAVDVSGAKLTDTFGSNDNLFASNTLENFTITNPDETIDTTYNGVNVAVGATINLPTIPSYKKAVITYRVQVDADKALSKSKVGSNVAEVDYNNGTKDVTAKGVAYVNPDVPTVSKGGSLSDDGKSITWTITVDPNSMVSNTDFIVVDTPTGLTPETIKNAISGSSIDSENTNNVLIPKSAFGEPNAETGAYSLSYTISPLPDEYIDQITEKDITNNISVTFDGKYEYTATSTVRTKAKDVTFIDKSVENFDYETGIINWKSVIYIPNDFSDTDELETYTFTDTLNSYIDYAPAPYGESRFADDIKSTIRIDGAPFSDDMGTFSHGYDSGSKYDTITIAFSKSFLDAHHDKNVVITYSSKMDTSAANYKDLTYRNVSKIDFRNSNYTIYRAQEDKAYIASDFMANKKTKTVYDCNRTKPGVLGWVINFRSINHTYEEGDEIVITDLLPEGYELIENPSDDYYRAIGMLTEGYEGSNWFPDEITTCTKSMEAGRQKLTIRIPVTAALATELNRSGNTLGNYLSVGFDICMTDEYYKQFNYAHASESSVNIQNSAEVSVGSKKVTVTGTQQVIPSTDGFLFKDIVSQTQTKSNEEFKAEYRIDVNSAGYDIISGAGSQELVVEDTLGTWLDIDISTVAVDPPVPAENITYDEDSRTLKVKIQDETPYIITYTVTGHCAYFKQSDEDNGVKPEYQDAMYSNKVKLSGAVSEEYNDSVKLDESTYKSSATYTYNMSLKGTKTWLKTEHASFIPKTVTIRVKITKTTPLGDKSVSYSDEDVEVSPVGNTWEYSIGNKPSMDIDGNRYEYEIEEIKVGGDLFENGGYTVVYDDATIDTNNDIVIDFENTFVADQNEKGALKVTKDWDHGSNSANAPADSITVKLYRVDGGASTYVGELTLSSTDDENYFEDLPLYTYSRDAVSDKLVRTPIQYKLEEGSVADYTPSYTINGAAIAAGATFTLTDVTAAGTSVDKANAKVVGITNKFEEADAQQKYGNIIVTKDWVDANNTENIAHPDSITFTLKSTDGSVNKTETIVGNDLTAEFNNLPVFEKDVNGDITSIPMEYTLTETSVEGYVTTYSLDGTSFADSCVITASEGNTNVTVKNTFDYTMEKGNVEIEKVWQNMFGNTDTNVNETITVTIKSTDGTIEGNVTITGNAKETISDLPVYRYTRSGTSIVKTPIDYVVSETVPSGYTVSYSPEHFSLTANSTKAVKVTNKENANIQVEKSIKVTKVWDDNNDAEKLRPESITVNLFADGTKVASGVITRPAESFVFEHLPVYKVVDGVVTNELVTYKVEEETIIGYDLVSIIPASATLETSSDVEFTVTNKYNYTKEYGKLTVTKKWTDANDSEITWVQPVEVTLTNSADNTVKIATITGANTPAVFENLPKYIYTRETDGSISTTPIKYTVTEEALAGYIAAYSSNGIEFGQNDESSITITNKAGSPDQEYGKLTVNKSWVDNNDAEELRPTSVKITLKNTATNEVYNATIGADNKYVFDALPVYKVNGNVVTSEKIEYELTEESVDGYTTTYIGNIDQGFTIDKAGTSVTIENKFTYIKPTAEIVVTKEWQDKNGNVISTAPEKITIELTSSNGFSAIQDIEIGDDTATFTGLHVYKGFERINGQIVGVDAITYSVRETLISSSDYETTISPDGSFTLENASSVSVKITNKQKDTTSPAPVVEKAKIIIKKEWTGDTNATSSRPATITFILKADGVELDRATVDSDFSGDVAEFKDLAVKKASGEKILYEVVEEAVTGYTTTYSVNGAFELLADEEKSIVVYNTYNVPSQSESSSNTTTSTVTTTVSGTNTTTSATTTTKAPTSSVVPPVTSPVVPSQTTTPKVTTTTAAPVVVTTTSAKNTTTTTVVPDTTEEEKEETTVITKEEEKLEVTTTADSDTDTTKPAETTEDLSEETTDIDDFTGSDSGITSDIEENPHTSITINFGYVLAFAFGTYAFFPRKKKRK